MTFQESRRAIFAGPPGSAAKNSDHTGGALVTRARGGQEGSAPVSFVAYEIVSLPPLCRVFESSVPRGPQERGRAV